MSILNFFKRKPRQPDMTFAANAFFPIALMQKNQIDIDLHDVIDGHAASLRRDGCSDHQALSAQWGGVSAIGQNLALFLSHVQAFEKTVAESPEGRALRERTDAKEFARKKYVAAATLVLAQIMADAPGEFERFLRYMGR